MESRSTHFRIIRSRHGCRLGTLLALHNVEFYLFAVVEGAQVEFLGARVLNGRLKTLNDPLNVVWTPGVRRYPSCHRPAKWSRTGTGPSTTWLCPWRLVRPPASPFALLPRFAASPRSPSPCHPPFPPCFFSRFSTLSPCSFSIWIIVIIKIKTDLSTSLLLHLLLLHRHPNSQSTEPEPNLRPTAHRPPLAHNDDRMGDRIRYGGREPFHRLFSLRDLFWI